MSKILDEGKPISHQALAARVDTVLDNDKFWAKAKISSTFDPNGLDWAMHPTVQSGGQYDLNFKSDPDDRNLHAGVIIVGLGLRYNTYGSFISRTYLVDPSKAQESNYKLLQAVHELVLKNIRDGAIAKDLYAKAIALVKSKKPDLESKFLRSVGYGIGIENKDSSLVLSAKSTRVLKDGMTLVVATGFQDLDNPDASKKNGRQYSLLIADTIRVHAGEAAIFTGTSTYQAENISFFFKDDEEPTPKKSAQRDSRIGAVAQQNITATRLRKERQANHDQEKEAARRGHQREIHERKRQQGLEKYTKGSGNINGSEVKKFKRFESYKRDDQFPSRVKDMGIVVDVKNSTVVLPIIGRPVPFHINTIKNASTTPEGEFTSLRINFLSPGQGVGRKDDQPFEDPNAQFVRSLTFRSKDPARMENIVNQITEMKKESVRREQEKKQLEDVVEQDKLVIDRRPQRLDVVFLRPAVDSKRAPGTVEIHQNGLRYVHSNGDNKVDVLFNNVKHLFFQPSKHELVVIIHLYLINPIMIGKRKTRDVQFFREATEMQFDETGNRKRKHRYGDEEEFEQEQEERRRRTELDKLFLNFAKKIEDAGRDEGLKVDMPFRDLGFNGVPSRSNVVVQPTTDCLVQLTEPPFMVVTLEDIEIAHLERVAVSLEAFLPNIQIISNLLNSSVLKTSTWSSSSRTSTVVHSTSTPFPWSPLIKSGTG
jgi:nucleosome binding factor SPN SPT16 subunit